MNGRFAVCVALAAGAIGMVLWLSRGSPVSAEVALSGADMPGLASFTTITRSDDNFTDSGNFGKSDHENVAGADTLIYGSKLLCRDANCWCDLYDATTVPSAANQKSQVIDELKEATDEEVAVQMWPKPYRISRGLTISVKNGVCIVYK